LKYLRGFLVAAAFALLAWGLTEFAASHVALVDMIYPYISRLIQDFLAGWTADAAYCLWQVLAIVLVVAFIASIVVMIVLKWNVFQWLGWVLSVVCLLWCAHTGIYGLNQYSSPLSEDIRLTVEPDITTTDLINATTYFRDKANESALNVPRNASGRVDTGTFEEAAALGGDGFQRLVYEKNLAVFAGSTVPVKQLGWADMYTSMGISGMTMPLTGEAAVNPQIPTVSLPFTICHEMAHRMCIAPERDANLAAFLASTANSDPAYQYSGYFMAFRYCYNALASMSTSTAAAAANRIYEGMNDALRGDIEHYRAYLLSVQDADASKLASSVNDAYIQASGDSSGVRSYGEVTDLLISWYLQEIYLPEHEDEVTEDKFDPLDKEDVFTEEVMGG